MVNSQLLSYTGGGSTRHQLFLEVLNSYSREAVV